MPASILSVLTHKDMVVTLISQSAPMIQHSTCYVLASSHSRPKDGMEAYQKGHEDHDLPAGQVSGPALPYLHENSKGVSRAVIKDQ